MLRMLLRKIDFSSEKIGGNEQLRQCHCRSNKLDLSNLENDA